MINWGLMVVTFDLLSLLYVATGVKEEEFYHHAPIPVTLPSLPRRPVGDTLLADLLTPRAEEARYNFVYMHNPVKDLLFMFLY